MSAAASERPKVLCIDATLLERMGRLARGFPGRTISIARPSHRSRYLAERIILHIDGVAADEVAETPTPKPSQAA